MSDGGAAPLRTSRRSSAVWSAVFGYLIILVALVRNVVLVPVYLGHIPLDEFGAWMASGGALVQLFLIDFGLAGTLMQRVSTQVGSGAWAKLGHTLGSGMLLSLLLATFLTSLALAWSGHSHLFVTLSPEAAGRVLACFRLAILTGGISIFTASTLGLLRSFLMSFTAGLLSVLADLFSIVVTVWLLLAGFGLYALAFGLLARALLLLLTSAVALGIEVRRHRVVRWGVGRDDLRSLLGGLFYWFFASIAIKVQTQANTVAVAYALGPRVAATYGLTVRAHETVQTLITQLAHAVAPSMAHLIGSGNTARFREVTNRLLPVLAALAAIGLAVTVACDRSFVSLWVGTSLYDGNLTSGFMAAAIWVSVLGYVGYDSLQARGEFRTIAIVYVATAVLHVVLLFALTRFGAFGAPVASLVSALAWTAIFWRSVERALPSAPHEWRSLLGTIARIGATGLAVGALGLLVVRTPARTWPEFGLLVFAFAAIATLGVWLAAPRAVALFIEEARLTLRRRQAT
jgi:O-antigen/teichoic acid export membrane protein